MEGKMKRSQLFPVLLVVLIATASTDAQEEGTTKWKATAFPTFDFGDVAVAKVVEKDEKELVSISQHGFERQSRPARVRVTEYKEEKRTRIVNVNGERKEQQYTVKVPYITERTVMRTALAPLSEINVFPLSEVRVWDYSGQRLTFAQMRTRLKLAQHVFLVLAGDEQTFAVDEYYRSVLNEDVLFVFANFPNPKPDPSEVIQAVPPPQARAIRIPASRLRPAILRPAPAAAPAPKVVPAPAIDVVPAIEND
jgi:hypothetical protein